MLVGGAVIANLREIAAAEPEQFCAPAMDGSLPAELSVTVLTPKTTSMVQRASETLLQSLHASRAAAAATAIAAAGGVAGVAGAASLSSAADAAVARASAQTAAAAAAAAASANASAVAAASTVTAGILASCGNARAW
jgi:hypothetical protein